MPADTAIKWMEPPDVPADVRQYAELYRELYGQLLGAMSIPRSLAGAWKSRERYPDPLWCLSGGYPDIKPDIVSG